MKTRPGMTRRSFLKGLGAVAGLLPLVPHLDVMAQSRFPTRLVVIFTANGTVHEDWRPVGTERDFQLSPILRPLERFKSQLLVMDGIAVNSASSGPGDDHQKGMGHLLTGRELLTGDEFPGCGGECAGSGWGGGISIDQFIANRLPEDTPYRSLELGVQNGGANIWSRMCYRDANSPIPPRDNPYDTFDAIFGGLDPNAIGLERLRRERQSVLDSVVGDLSALERQLTGRDRARLQAHLAAVRSIERRLAADPAELGLACELPMLGDRVDPYANDNYPHIGRLQMDMLAMSLACNLTRVASLQWSTSVSNTRFSWLDNPIAEGHHDLSHFDDSSVDALGKLTRINTWYAEQLAYLLDRLDAIPEGDGTLLDNTVVVWVNELGRGNNHSHFPVPFLTAGKAGGRLKTGRFLDFGRTPHNNLLVSLCHAMGLDDVTTFGNPTYCTGPLSGLT